MKISMTQQTTLLQTIHSLHPISAHPSYSEDLDYSDKLILPRSIFFVIRSLHYPVPPVFILRCPRTPLKSITCGVLDFSASENTLFAPKWIQKKLSTRSKYSTSDIRLEIFQTSQIKSSLFPLLSRIEVTLDSDIEAEHCKKALMRYTVVTKGDSLNIFHPIAGKSRVFVNNLLPRNRCIIKSSNFELNIIQKAARTTVTEEDDKQKDLIRISLISKSKVFDRRHESVTPWEHRVRPIRIEGDSVSILPWGSESSNQENFLDQVVQTLPEIPKAPRKKTPEKKKKVLSFAFPQVSMLDLRPLTTVNKESQHKSVSFSPISRVG
jgi:hypothetical protein